MNPGCGGVPAAAGRDIRTGGDTLSLPAWILPARGCLSFHFPPATSPTPGAAWKTAGIGVSSKAPFPVSLQLGIGVQGCTNTPECGGGQWRPGYCPQSARIPCDSHVLIPTYQDPKPEEDPAGHRERRVLVLRRCQDDPEADVDNSSEDVDGLGKDEGEGSQSRCCETHPTPIPHHNAGKGLGQAPVPMSPALSRTIPADPQSLEGRVSPPTPWDEPSGSLAFGMTSWQAQASGSPRPAGLPGDPWPGSPP